MHCEDIVEKTKKCMSCGAALPPDALRRLIRVLGGVAAAAGVLSALGQPLS